jgi:hypothetical protein
VKLRSALSTYLVILSFIDGKQAIRAEEEPRVVKPGPPPADAIVLFGGTDLSQWQGEGGGKASWLVKDGVATVNGTGSIVTKQPFGDCQLQARITVLQNGVLVQDHLEIKGPTAKDPTKYEPHPLKQPLVLRDHGNPMRFRNIWIREL